MPLTKQTKTRLLIIAIILMSMSFYSIGPVLCDELFTNACYSIYHTEHFYTVLPFFLAIFMIGLIIFLVLRKLSKTTMVISGIIISLVITVIVLYEFQPFSVEIEELEQEYRSGEPIVFVLRATGFGNVCPNPNVSIISIDTPLASVESKRIWEKTFPRCTNPEFKFFNHFWVFDKNTEPNLLLNKTGKFELRASYGNKQTEKQFVITQ